MPQLERDLLPGGPEGHGTRYGGVRPLKPPTESRGPSSFGIAPSAVGVCIFGENGQGCRPQKPPPFLSGGCPSSSVAWRLRHVASVGFEGSPCTLPLYARRPRHGAGKGQAQALQSSLNGRWLRSPFGKVNLLPLAVWIPPVDALNGVMCAPLTVASSAAGVP